MLFRPRRRPYADKLTGVVRLRWTTYLLYHVGDVPNAASVTLDDSSWTKAQAGGAPPQGASWIRYWVVVPKSVNGYDLTGATIGFRPMGRGTQEIYVNGELLVRLPDDQRPTILFTSAKPGDKALIAMKMAPPNGNAAAAAGRGGRGGTRGLPLTVEIPATRLDPQILHDEFLTAALLIPSASPASVADEQKLNQAITDVNLQALDTADQAAFDASLRKAHQDLEALKPFLKSIRFNLSGNSHIDAAWTWPWTETVDVVNRTFSSAILLMTENPDYTYSQSASQYNVWMADKNPRLNAQIKRRIQEGRWDLVGGMWVEPDLNMPTGESLVRQLLIGERTLKDLYGVTTDVGWNPDSFGYNWQLPQIYAKSGVRYFVTQKMAWNDTNLLPLKLFWWQSPDGSKVLGYFPDGYGNSNLDPTCGWRMTWSFPGPPTTE